jgi:hypothetical protein
MFTDPLGICDEFKFRIGNVVYTTQVYIVRKASFQLLLGTEFIWKAGIGLFPRWGAIMLSLPEFQVIQGTCERITTDKALPLLVPLANSSSTIDPTSGIPTISLPHQDARFSYLDTRKLTIPFLKVSVSPSVISIGERDYLKDKELDAELDPASASAIPPHIDVPTISDTYICANIDIYTGASAWFKNAMVRLIMKYHQVISWHEYDLGSVSHSPHDIQLIPGTKGI